MSRSNPSDFTPSPCTRWHEFDGTKGTVRYYDKEKKENVDIGSKFTFIPLDILATVKGWHDASDSGIFANEVRDTKQETFVVKAFKGGILAEGLYATIRDRVKAQGGHFVANLYCGYKNEKGELLLGSIQFKGAALNAWVEFSKNCGTDKKNVKLFWSKAVKITGFEEGKKGNIKFRVPKFEISEITEKTNTEAVTLDTVLQAYLKSYFARTRIQQVAQPAAPVAENTPGQTNGKGETGIHQCADCGTYTDEAGVCKNKSCKANPNFEPAEPDEENVPF